MPYFLNILRYFHTIQQSKWKSFHNSSVTIFLLQENDLQISTTSTTEDLKGDDGRYVADLLWNHIHNIKRPDGRLRFGRLSRVAMLILTMPHSNVDEERVSSLIRKNKTSYRPNLDPDETLSIIMVKMELLSRNARDKYIFPPNVLHAAKSATRNHNRAHKS